MILDVPSVIVGRYIATENAGRAYRCLAEDGVTGCRVGRIVENRILLGQRAAVGIQRGYLAAFVRLK